MKRSISENVKVEGVAARSLMKPEVSYDDEDDLVRQVHGDIILRSGGKRHRVVTSWECA